MPRYKLEKGQPWPEDIPGAEVCFWVGEETETHLILFYAAYRQKNNGGMIEHIKALRHVGTRLEQFRRMKVRQWNAAASAKPKTEALKP